MAKTPKRIHRFANVSDAVKFSTKGRDKEASSSKVERSNAAHTFYETRNFQEAAKLAIEGWQGARVDMERFTETIKEQVLEQVTRTYDPVWDVTGSVVDVEAYLNGEPECMIEFVPEPSLADLPAITILVSTDYSGGFSTQEVLQRGAAICGLVDVLMTLGFGVEVYAETSSHKNGEVWAMLTKLKEANDYVDMDSIAFVLAHPSWLRRIVFGVMESEVDAIRQQFGFTAHGGYGRPGELSFTEEVGATITVGSVLKGRDGQNIRKPTDWIMDTLKGLGVGNE